MQPKAHQFQSKAIQMLMKLMCQNIVNDNNKQAENNNKKRNLNRKTIGDIAVSAIVQKEHG